jgi:creatinine amidohydrolase
LNPKQLAQIGERYMGYSIFDDTMVDMTWPEIERAVREGAIVILPTGVIEEHGPHLSLGVDAYCSYLLCKHTKEKLQTEGIASLIAPPYYWGINNVTGSFPGSFTVRKETMRAILYDILVCMRGWGITHVFNINWHGDYDHNVTILESIKEARDDIGIKAYCVLKDSKAAHLGLTGNEPHVIIWKRPSSSDPPPKYLQIHGGSTETSIMSYYFPKEVNRELAITLKSTNLTVEDLAVWRKGSAYTRELTPSGYFGDPASFNPITGKELMEENAQSVSNVILNFMRGTYTPPETIE